MNTVQPSVSDAGTTPATGTSSTPAADAIETGFRSGRASAAKDLAICAVIFCGASIAWFGWGQQGGRFGALLGAGSVLAVLATVAAAIGIRHTPGTPSMSVDAGVRRSYGIAVVAEVILIAAGAYALGRLDRPEFISAWTLAVVGVHFLPLARAFRLPVLTWAAVGCVLAAGAAVAGDLAGVLPAPTIAGLGGGLVLLVAGLLSQRMTCR